MIIRNTDPTIRVKGRRVVYTLGVDEAEELASILNERRGDTGWAQDSRKLFDACEQIRGETHD